MSARVVIGSRVVLSCAMGLLALVPRPAAAQPPTLPAAPTAKSAAQPTAHTKADASTSGTLRFTRLSIKDPGINNIEAISYLIPQGWKPEGGVQWFPDYSILANLLMTITDPATGAQIRFLPMQNFTWIEHPVMPLQPGSNYMGNIVSRPPADVPAFLQTFYAPQAMPQLRHAEELRKMEEQVRASWGGRAQVMSSRVRYEYEQAGKPWEEDVFVTLVVNRQQGMALWSVSSAYSFRAPKGTLDRLSPLMATTVSTARLSPDWYAGYMYVSKLFQDRMNQGIKNAAAISATITRNSEEIRKMYADSYKQRCESEDKISRNFGEYIRGVQTYENPYDSRPVELPSGYQDAWVSASGEYLLSSQPGLDPNVGSTVEWRRMAAPPNKP